MTVGFAASPPSVDSAGSAPLRLARLRLARVARRTFSAPAAFLADPDSRAHLAGYLTDLTRPYQLSVPPARFDSPDTLGQSYGEMAEVLIRELIPDDQPVDLLVLAFAVPDMWPGRATATYLSHVCPGSPLSFAICEQGSASAFSGLRVARDYAATTGCSRALLLVLEQAVLPYPVGAARVPAQHRAVALLFDTSSDAPELAGIRLRGGVPPAEVAGLAASELDLLTAGLPGTPRLLLSESLAGLWPDADAEIAPAGQPHTGLWWLLSDELSDSRSMIVVDYEPDLGYLSLAAFTTS